MNLKLFYSPPWKAFIAPEKPRTPLTKWLSENENPDYYLDMQRYEYDYAEAKANALEVGNDKLIDPRAFMFELGKEYDWPGSAVIKDGKYILSI